MTHKKQELQISTDWTIKQNEFYDIDPFDNYSNDDKFSLIFAQEDLLWISKGLYNIDLGWYGGDDLKSEDSGFCIYLYRGLSWHKCDLMEIFRSKDKNEVAGKLNSFIGSVDDNEYKDIEGYKIDEDDINNKNSMEDFKTYSVQKK